MVKRATQAVGGSRQLSSLANAEPARSCASKIAKSHWSSAMRNDVAGAGARDHIMIAVGRGRNPAEPGDRIVHLSLRGDGWLAIPQDMGQWLDAHIVPGSDQKPRAPSSSPEGRRRV